jgi:malonyl-CoA/methylmalonyl-CoA synthetase
MLFEALEAAPERVALRTAGRTLTYAELRDAAARVAGDVAGAERVAVWALPLAETAVAVVGALLAGVPVVAINPKAGERELAHILGDSDPEAVLCPPAADVPGAVAARRAAVDLDDRGGALPPEPPDEAPAIIVYTSGTTGPPKGAVLPRRAIASNLDALAAAWEWTADDVVAHALPLFHVHGLVIGTLGPLRRGGTSWHLGRFSSRAVAAALGGGEATMLFAVPTMYHRLADDAEAEPAIGRALGRARLLVSGSAALPAVEHERLARLTGQRIVERYGMTETLMNTAVRASDQPRPGYVGRPLDGIDVRLVDDAGAPLDVADDETVGELAVRGPNLFLGYLNRPDATAEALHDCWFRTGDLATRAPDGFIRIVGRRATDLIKSGGFKIGAGEIEGALLEHPGVAEAAVTGEPDADLGERIVAWVVARPGDRPSAEELTDHVAALLTPHKRPRDVRFLDALPRNEMGKVQKQRLPGASLRR